MDGKATTESFYQSRYTYDEQLEELALLIEDVHIRKSRRVRGEYASNEYVTWRLNQIFTPAGWTFEILDGPTYTNISEGMAFVQMTGRLSVTFANGHTSFRDEVGIWPLYAKESNGQRLLDKTPPEMYELAYKAVLSDCLKACAERFGNTFRPLLDGEFQGWLRYQQNEIRRHAASPTVDNAKEAIEQLYGDYDNGTANYDRELAKSDSAPIGKDPADLIAKGQSAMEEKPTVENGDAPTFLDPPPEKDWTEFYRRCTSELGYDNRHHASKVKDQYWVNVPDPNWNDLWTHMIEHQAEKGHLSA